MKIFDNVPVPPRANSGKTKYPFADLGVGQSLFIEIGEGEDHTKALNRVAGNVSRYRRTLLVDTVKFSVRLAPHPESGDQTVGVWRTA